MSSKLYRLEKVISSGQTGTDQAGLATAKRFGILTGGWAPKNWMTKDGPNADLALYGLKEHKGGYKQRTHSNVEDSDATIRLAVNFNSLGERCTMNAIQRFGKPYFDVDLKNPCDPDQVRRWLIREKVKALNVAGNSQYRWFDVYGAACVFLSKVFKALGYEEVN